MKKIGITGGIGSGKTFVAKIFEWMGIPVYHSDSAAKHLMNVDAPLKKKLIKLLGEKSYINNTLNRTFIAEAIFNNPDLLAKVNKLVHPAVRKDFENWFMEKKNADYVINEAALFVENGSYQSFDYLVTVLCPLPLRLERTVKRDRSTKEKFYERYQKQSSDSEKIAKSHFLIYNDYTESLIQQCVKIHKTILLSLRETDSTLET